MHHTFVFNQRLRESLTRLTLAMFVFLGAAVFTYRPVYAIGSFLAAPTEATLPPGPALGLSDRDYESIGRDLGIWTSGGVVVLMALRARARARRRLHSAFVSVSRPVPFLLMIGAVGGAAAAVQQVREKGGVWEEIDRRLCREAMGGTWKKSSASAGANLVANCMPIAEACRQRFQGREGQLRAEDVDPRGESLKAEDLPSDSIECAQMLCVRRAARSVGLLR